MALAGKKTHWCRDALHREFKDATVLKLLVAMDKDTR